MNAGKTHESSNTMISVKPSKHLLNSWRSSRISGFQETLSAMALFLGFDSSTQSLKATAIGAQDLQAVWFCMVMGCMMEYMCSKAWWSLQLLPLDPSSPPISSPPPPLSTLTLCFLVPKCLHQLDLLTLHKHFTLHCPPVKFLNVCFLFFLMLLPIFQRQLPNFFCIIYYLPFFSCKASTTSSILSPKHFQHLMPSYAVYSYKLQHCFFSTSSTTSSSLPILCF